MLFPVVDSYACVGCGACYDACSFGAIALVDNVAVIEKSACKRCKKCVGLCPLEAISMKIC